MKRLMRDVADDLIVLLDEYRMPIIAVVLIWAVIHAISAK